VNRGARWVLLGLGLGFGLVACGEGPSTSSESAASTAASESESSSDSLDTSTSTGETETGETGESCTGEVCSSTLTLTFTHALPLLDAPHRFLITTPLFDLVCGVETSLEGQKSCFGWAFTDMSWTAQTVTVLLTNPFHDTNLNPDALPFDSVSVQVERGQEVVWMGDVQIDGGEPSQPDPCSFECWSAVGGATIE
jgi:hypothetical protein